MPEQQKKRILLVVRQLGLGGTEQHILDLATGLDPEWFDIEILSFTPGGEIAARLAVAGIPVHHVGKSFKYDPTFPLRLAGRMRGLYDVVHTFLLPGTVWGLPAAAIARAPRRIASVRGLGFAESAVKRTALRTVVPLAEKFLCNSQAGQRVLTERIGVPAVKIEVLCNAVDTKHFRPRPRNDWWRALREELRLPADGTVVGCVANLTPVKQHALLLDAMRLVADARPDARLVLIGDGPLRAALEAQAEQLGIRANIHFLGRLLNIAELLPLLDIFVLSSKTESLPNSVCEAMATGLPCVVTDVGGLREIVADGETGCVVPPGDAGAFADRILSLTTDREKMSRMGGEARRRAVEMFSMGHMLKRMEEIYRGEPRGAGGG